MKTCEKCHILIRRGRLCCACRAYQRKGGIWHPLPPYGTVQYDDEGRPICHVCGMAFDKLIEHTKRKHGLGTVDYRAEFGLMRKNAHLTSPKYADKMHGYTEEYKTHKQNFAEVQKGIGRGKRKITRWSSQETELRRDAQREIVKKRWEKVYPPEQLAKAKQAWTRNLPNGKKVQA